MIRIIHAVKRIKVGFCTATVSFFCVGLSLLSPVAQSRSDEHRVALDTPQLFVDDYLIENTQHVIRAAHEAEKYFPNPVLTYTEPWEGNCAITYGSVLRDEREGVFKCWYEAYKQTAPPGEQTLLCLATSSDGIYWKKPTLGMVDYHGSRQNNIVLSVASGAFPDLAFDSPVIIQDERDPNPKRRYKMMLHFRKGGGLYDLTSPDGIHWKLEAGPLVRAGDRSGFYYNPFREAYTFLSRPGTPSPVTGVQRWVALWESKDLRTFGELHPALWPDKQDTPGTEIYSLQPFVNGSLVLGYIEMFYYGEKDPRYRRLDTQLAVSHDGMSWQRALDRAVFLPYGPVGSWDGGWVCPSSNPPIRFGDRLFIYYQGRRTYHWGKQPKLFEQEGRTYEINDPRYGHVGSVGLAFLRVDGFASMDASSGEGTLLTKLLVLPSAKALTLNARAAGSVRVAVLNQAGELIGEYEESACEPFAGDTLAHVVRWNRGKGIGDLGGRTVRFRFHLKDASLYSFQLCSAPGRQKS
jgi:hypothetical protein